MCGMKKEMVNKFFVLFLFAILLFSFLLSDLSFVIGQENQGKFVPSTDLGGTDQQSGTNTGVLGSQSAQPTLRPSVGTSVSGSSGGGVEKLFNTLLSDSSIGSFFANFNPQSDWFIKLLFSILIFLIVGSIIRFIPLFKQHGDNWSITGVIISAVITALSVLYIPTQLLQRAVDPYTALGVSIIGILPFILMYTFVYKSTSNSFIRMGAWIMYGLVLIFLAVDSHDWSVPFLAKGNVLSLIYTVSSLVAFLMIFISEWFWHKMYKGALEGGAAKMNNYIAMRERQIRIDNARWGSETSAA